MQGWQPDGRDVLFVPVGLAYDRVLEDRVLVTAHAEGVRKFRAGIGTILRFGLKNLWRKLRGRFRGFGTAAAGFGPPVSLRWFMGENPGVGTEGLGAHLMAEIEKVVPVLPVPLVAAALQVGVTDRDALAARLVTLSDSLAAAGAVLKLPPQGLEQALDEGLAPLIGRGLVGDDLRITAGSEALMGFYAAPVWQRLQQGPQDFAATRQT